MRKLTKLFTLLILFGALRAEVYYYKGRYTGIPKAPVPVDDGGGLFLGLESSAIRTRATLFSGKMKDVFSPYFALHGGTIIPFGKVARLELGGFVGGILHGSFWLGTQSKLLFYNPAKSFNKYIGFFGFGGGLAGVLPIAKLAYYFSLDLGSEFGRHSVAPFFKYFFGANTFSLGATYSFRF